ncbi:MULTISPECIES: hypothetical protein [Vogesella]|jgi:hypothetical protein|uniref:Uncharacterized protein n=1 Tax=Vogesella aquatica TaxID=2984206 RepID=A0ABT5IUI2_9NEIS|nr:MULTISPECIES: hypothetical protein [Vogesella]MBP7581370.1 hypothetical protein [Vogesella sp.]MDC7716162.1 hypothetical protein [Vogesella aquatica]UDM17277.1 hypothetical protein LCH97_00960 [Vogesella sp. XCS3]
MKINELKPGDCVTQELDNSTVAFEVVAIRQIGRRFLVTFRSALGIASASYQGDAYISLAH